MLKNFATTFLKHDARKVFQPKTLTYFRPLYFSTKDVELRNDQIKFHINIDNTIPGDYNYNMTQLNEIYKVLKGKIDHLEISKIVSALKVFATHKYANEDLYKIFEAAILRKIHAITPEDFVTAVTYISLMHTNVSEKFILIAEHKVIKLLGKITPEQFVQLLRAFQKFDSTSNKFIRSMHTYFTQKIKDFTPAEIIEASFFLIVSKMLSSAQFDELTHALFTRFPKDISKLSASSALKFLDLIIIQKEVIQYREANPQGTKSYEETKAGIMAAIHGAAPYQQAPAAIPEGGEQQIFDLEKFLPRVAEHLQKFAAEKQLSLKQLTVVLENLKSLNAEIPDVFLSELVRKTVEDAQILDPSEFTRVYRVLHNIEISEELRAQLGEAYKTYLYNYMDQMNGNELAESWSLIDFAKPPDAEEMMERLKRHIKESINRFQLPGLVRFVHLQIATAHLLNRSQAEQPDEFLMEGLLPKMIQLLQRNKNAKDALLLVQWFNVLDIREQKMLEQVVGILKDVEIKDARSYLFFTKFLEQRIEKKEDLNGLCQSALVFLEEKYKPNQIAKKE